MSEQELLLGRKATPPKRRSMNAFALRSCLYSTSSVFSRCPQPNLRQRLQDVLNHFQELAEHALLQTSMEQRSTPSRLPLT